MDKIVTKGHLESFINDPGIQISHKAKDAITLDDIFIFPELKHNAQRVINSRELTNICSSGNKVLISGIEDSGKTTLLKALIKHYLEAGYGPLYLDLNNYDITNLQQLISIIDSEFEMIYGEKTNKEIKGQLKGYKAVFMDNLDSLELDSESIVRILKELYSSFDNIYITEKIPLDLVRPNQLSNLFPELSSDMSHYEIIEFNHELRAELIDKWYNLDPQSEVDIEKNKLRIDKTTDIIDNVIESKLAPSYPIFLLTILQMSGQDEDELTSGSSYSYYHEYRIIKSIQESIKNDKVENYINFLSELAFNLFDKLIETISYDDLRLIFETSQMKESNYDEAIESLIKAGILTIAENSYLFRYKNSYYYFVAKYLSEHMNEASGKDIIKELCSELGNDDSANIVLFITYLTDQTFIVDEIIDNTNSVISDIEDYVPEEKSPEFEELIKELSKLGTKDRKLKELPGTYSSTNSYGDLDFRNSRSQLLTANNVIKIAKQIMLKNHIQENKQY